MSRKGELPFDKLRANGEFEPTFVVSLSNHGPALLLLVQSPRKRLRGMVERVFQPMLEANCGKSVSSITCESKATAESPIVRFDRTD